MGIFDFGKRYEELFNAEKPVTIDLEQDTDGTYRVSDKGGDLQVNCKSPESGGCWIGGFLRDYGLAPDCSEPVEPGPRETYYEYPRDHDEAFSWDGNK